ncbi:Luc7-like protein 3 [Varanus komodoensis]|nr:Luc7-like protein 3 [Varanus komodoensis]
MISAAQLLDELMGRDRNLAPDEKRSNVRWDHESVCKYYLCGFCPAELFTNTRSDLGPCEKIHDENLRKQYEKSSRFMKVGYEREFLRYLQSLLAEVERRIRRGHARLALSQTQQASGQAAGPTGKNEEKIQVLTDKIDVLLQQIEELGSEGKVEEAQGMMKLVEQLKEERELLRSTTSTIESFAAQEKQMEVCEVCGAFLIVGDAQSRVDDHLMGKQHMGYAKIKATVEELKPFRMGKKLHKSCQTAKEVFVGKRVKLGKRNGAIWGLWEAYFGPEASILAVDKHIDICKIREKLRKRTEEPERDDRLKKEKLEREEREREREKEEKERKRRREEEEKEKERARDRERRKRSRSRSRHSSRTSDRRGSRSRDHKRSRSKDRRRSRSRDRRRSRSHDRSDRKHRSRSRDRRRSKSRDRKSYKHRSKSREREQDRKSKEKEKRGSDDKKSSVKSSSREKQSEDTSMDCKEGDAKNEVNGTSEDIKSEGDTQSN